MMAASSQAGLGPHQVLLVYDAENEQSIEVAHHYASLRQIPQSHFCPLTLGDVTHKTISVSVFTESWVPALQNCLAGLAPQEVWAFALSSHLPHRVELEAENHRVSLVAALQAFFLTGEGAPFFPASHPAAGNTLLPSIHNPLFVGTENPTADFAWRSSGDANYNATSSLVRTLLLPGQESLAANAETLSGPLALAFHLEGMRHVDSLALLENAIAGESAPPLQANWAAMRGVSEARQVRDPEAHFLAEVLSSKGRASEFVTTHDGTLLPNDLVGFFTGTELLHDVLAHLDFHPAAMADNLTSYGAVPANWVCSEAACPENEVQTAIGHLIALGASQVHGTVDEPLNNSFPNMGAYYLYDAGYTAAESWFYNQPYLFWQNAYWGDGLAAPFAQRPHLELEGTASHLRVKAEHEAGITWMGAFQSGLLVQESSDDILEMDWAILGEADLLLVAQADVFEDRHDGLKVPAQTNASRPMGWLGITKTDWQELIPEDAQEAKGCGCNATSKTTLPYSLLLWVAALIYLKGRRSSRRMRL